MKSLSNDHRHLSSGGKNKDIVIVSRSKRAPLNLLIKYSFSECQLPTDHANQSVEESDFLFAGLC